MGIVTLTRDMYACPGTALSRANAHSMRDDVAI